MRTDWCCFCCLPCWFVSDPDKDLLIQTGIRVAWHKRWDLLVKRQVLWLGVTEIGERSGSIFILLSFMFFIFVLFMFVSPWKTPSLNNSPLFPNNSLFPVKEVLKFLIMENRREWKSKTGGALSCSVDWNFQAFLAMFHWNKKLFLIEFLKRYTSAHCQCCIT